MFFISYRIYATINIRSDRSTNKPKIIKVIMCEYLNYIQIPKKNVPPETPVPIPPVPPVPIVPVPPVPKPGPIL